MPAQIHLVSAVYFSEQQRQLQQIFGAVIKRDYELWLVPFQCHLRASDCRRLAALDIYFNQRRLDFSAFTKTICSYRLDFLTLCQSAQRRLPAARLRKALFAILIVSSSVNCL
jgi:hypothetical protein